MSPLVQRVTAIGFLVFLVVVGIVLSQATAVGFFMALAILCVIAAYAFRLMHGVICAQLLLILAMAVISMLAVHVELWDGATRSRPTVAKSS